MRKLTIFWLVGGLFLLFGEARAQEAPPDAPVQDAALKYEDKVRNAMVAVPGGLSADAAAAAAAADAPSVDAVTAEIERVKASQDRTLARFVPRVTLSASATRNNKIDFNFGGGLQVGALNAGQIQVGQCADGSGNNCVVDSAGSPVVAVEAQPFETPQNNYALQAQINIPISDYILALQPARRASNADIAGARLRRDSETRKVELDARVAFYEWLRARAQVAVAEQSLVSVRARLSDAKVGLASGTVAPADVLQIESLEASAQVAIVNAKSFETLARTNLAVLMSAKDDNFKIGEDVLSKSPAAPDMGLAKLVAHGHSNRASVRALEQAEVSADQAAAGAKVAQYPRLDAFATVDHANPNQRYFPPSQEWNTSWTIGLSLSWGLDNFFSARAQSKELAATQREFSANLVAVKRGVTLEVTSAWQEYRRAAAAVELNKVDQAAAEAAYKQRVALYQAGEATTAEVVEAETQRFNSSLRSINSRIDVFVALSKLRRAAALDRKTVVGAP